MAIIAGSGETRKNRASQGLKASTILLLHGLSMLCQGIIGEYMARIHIETQGRPNYIVDSVISGRSPQRHS
jgi:hypothetical protein